jgi:2-polyprenyl-3-methyl-5-hydroxy-6-metoxy-1,4-benzoquinol methylase
MTAMSAFSEVEDVWSARLGNLRSVVRQHVIREQLHAHLGGVATVLDVGCGQGTQAIELAARGL